MNLPRERLVELVVHLTDCSVTSAIAAVDAAMHYEPKDTEESLEILAKAMVLVRRPLDLRERLDLADRDDQDANVGGRRFVHGAADSS
jgi:chemotaxis regulatin CheY-phosphate phosphatase CheZ